MAVSECLWFHRLGGLALTWNFVLAWECEGWSAGVKLRQRRHRLVIAIQRPPRRSHKQSAWVIGRNRSALTRNLNERSVVVHMTPLGGVNCLSTNRNDGKHEQRGNRECTGNFHWKASLGWPNLPLFAGCRARHTARHNGHRPATSFLNSQQPLSQWPESGIAVRNRSVSVERGRRGP